MQLWAYIDEQSKDCECVLVRSPVPPLWYAGFILNGVVESG